MFGRTRLAWFLLGNILHFCLLALVGNPHLTAKIYLFAPLPTLTKLVPLALLLGSSVGGLATASQSQEMAPSAVDVRAAPANWRPDPASSAGKSEQAGARQKGTGRGATVVETEEARQHSKRSMCCRPWLTRFGEVYLSIFQKCWACGSPGSTFTWFNQTSLDLQSLKHAGTQAIWCVCSLALASESASRHPSIPIRPKGGDAKGESDRGMNRQSCGLNAGGLASIWKIFASLGHHFPFPRGFPFKVKKLPWPNLTQKPRTFSFRNSF